MEQTTQGHRTGAGISVLLAVHPSRTLNYAHAFAERGCAPIVAFSRRQVEAFGCSADILLADDDIDPGGAGLDALRGISATTRVFLGTPRRVPAQNVECLDVDIPPERVVAHALAIFDARAGAPSETVIAWGALQLDLHRRRALWKGAETNLTATQFDILVALVRAGGAVVTKEDLQLAAWPNAEPDNSERLLAHIRRIRMRLEEDPGRPTLLLTSRGVGFRLADPLPDPPPVALVSTDGRPPAATRGAGRERDASA